MMLRASSDKKKANADINVITGDGSSDGGIKHGKLLIDLVDAVLDEPGGDPSEARQRLTEAAGPGLVVEAGAVLAIFHLNDRVADACGVPLDEFGIDIRRAVGDQLGLDAGVL
jgi:hypothetical protein